MDFEDEYLDVLQNIEFAIVSVYHERPEMLDYDVDVVVAALIKQYQAVRPVARAQNLRNLGAVLAAPWGRMAWRQRGDQVRRPEFRDVWRMAAVRVF